METNTPSQQAPVQIKSFGIVQTATIMASIYFVLTLIIFIPIGLVMMAIPSASESAKMPGVVFFFLPFVYGVLGFVFIALGCAVYNFIAGYVGGIEITLRSK